RGAMAVRRVEGAREAAPPRAAVFSDLAQRLHDERILPDALLDRRQLAGPDELRELGRLLERLRELRRVRDDFRSFELADEVRAGLRALRAGARRHDGGQTGDRRGHEAEPENGASRETVALSIAHRFPLGRDHLTRPALTAPGKGGVAYAPPEEES